MNKINFINKQKPTLVTSIPALNLLFKRAFSSKQYNKSRLKLTWNSTDASLGGGGGGGGVGRVGIFKTRVSHIPLMFGLNI